LHALLVLRPVLAQDDIRNLEEGSLMA
jgi:hypothetical protein